MSPRDSNSGKRNVTRRQTGGHKHSMTNNNVVSQAVSAINAELSKATLDAGVRTINAIRNEQSKVADCNSRIKSLQTELQALNDEQFTTENVFGGSVPATSNSDTITKVIEAMNKSRQFPVEQKSQRIVSAITAEHDAVAALNKRIAELRADLAKLDAPTVTVEAIIS
jgi:predicted transcriptional regulator